MTSKSYEVTDPVEGKRGQRTARLVFTDQPDPDIALIAGDVLYNLRTAFDYLVGSLVLPSERSKVLCPLLHEPVWDIPHSEGESNELTRNRAKWASLTGHIKSDEAVEILKELMPLDARTPPPKMHPLDLLNRLSNRDPVVVMQVNDRWGNILLPFGLTMVLEWLRNEAISRLAPYSLPG
jgi:hypothetical protein